MCVCIYIYIYMHVRMYENGWALDPKRRCSIILHAVL